MKKYIFTLAITFFAASRMYSAEITLGTRLGLGLNANFYSASYSSVVNTLPGTYESSSGPGFSYSAGILASFMFQGASYGFEVQLNFARYFSKINNDILSGRDNLYISALEAAIPFKISLLAGKVPSEDVHHPYVLIGPIFSFPLKASIAGSGVTDNLNPVSFGILLALGGRLRLKGRNIVFVELEFKAFVTDKLKGSARLKDFRFQFCIGYEFNLSKSGWDN